MPLPDVSEVLTEWLDTYTIKTVTRQTVDFEPADTTDPDTIEAVIQPADKTALSKGQDIDWAKAYILIHTPDTIVNGQFIVYGGEDYKIISTTPWGRAGYIEAIGEQTKRAAV